jgi:hypothetical protein
LILAIGYMSFIDDKIKTGDLFPELCWLELLSDDACAFLCKIKSPSVTSDGLFAINLFR